MFGQDHVPPRRLRNRCDLLVEAPEVVCRPVAASHWGTLNCSCNERGKPVIRGTRTPVSLVVGSRAGGMNFEDVQREYGLGIEDMRAALKVAGDLVEQEQHHPLPS